MIITFISIIIIVNVIMEVRISYDPVCPSVCVSVGRSIKIFLKGRDVSLTCFYRSTCYNHHYSCYNTYK